MTKQKGFTLIEVVVAFVLLSLVLATSYQVFTTGMQRASDLEDQSLALVIAQSRLAEASLGENFKLGANAGESEDRRFRWNVTIAEFDSGMGAANAASATSTATTQTYYPLLVSVHVTWLSGASREKALDLSTLVLGKVGT